MARWQSGNVLQVGKEGRQLWHFSAVSGKVHLQRSELRLPTEPLPARLVGKDWQTLVQPKLNVAWLPPEHVFLRTLQLPKSDLEETRSMVELQLEKLSPMPVAQIVWGFELLPQPLGGEQTAVVAIVARSVVEEFLGHLESQNFLADRLELSLVDQVRAIEVSGDGVWIIPGIGREREGCLLAWWYAGVLQHLSLIHLPPGDRQAALLREQVLQTIWAGELDGWLTSAPRVHVVADPAESEPWLQEFIAEEGAVVVPPTPPEELATRTVRRLAHNDNTTNLLPPEHAARYRQRFIDRLWMRGLGAIFIVYLLGIAAYFGWVEFDRWRLDSVNEQAGQLANSYTNVLRLKEHVRVLQDQLDLQYAALDCWKAVTDYLPQELTLQSINFERGRKLTLSGFVNNEDSRKVQDFNEAMRLAQVKDQPLFGKVSPPNMNTRPGGQQMDWIFPCELKRVEAE